MKPEPIDENDLVELIQRMGITVYGPAAEAVEALAIELQDIRDSQWEAMLAKQKGVHITHTPVQPAPQQEQYLLNGTRFKLNFDGEGTVFCFRNYFNELQGRWVALVAAEDDCHLKAQPVAQPVAEETLRKVHRYLDDVVYHLKGSGKTTALTALAIINAAPVVYKNTQNLDTSQERVQKEPNFDHVICPQCCNQFRAIPVNVQEERRMLLEALKEITDAFASRMGDWENAEFHDCYNDARAAIAAVEAKP